MFRFCSTIVHHNDLMNYYIPIPSYHEQMRISSIINKQCDLIDKAIDATKTSIDDYKMLRSSLIDDAVTKGIHNNRTFRESGNKWMPLLIRL